MKYLLDKLGLRLDALPEQTQLAVGLIKQGNVDFGGLIKDKRSVIAVENRHAAYEIGSITKIFTANMLARLITERKINLNDSVAKFLPFKLKNNPVLTLRNLVTHTSGLPRLPPDFFSYPEYDEHNPYLNYTEQRLINYLYQGLELENVPGTKFSYSNLGYGVLSYVLSVINGCSFAELIQKEIFAPTGMMNTGFDRNMIASNLIKGLDKKGEIVQNWDGGILNGCVGVISTVYDVSLFASQVLNPQNEVSTLQLKQLEDLRPGVKMCMAWASSWPEPSVYWHGGGTAGYGSIIALNRKQQVAVVILSNIQPEIFKAELEPCAMELFSCDL